MGQVHAGSYISSQIFKAEQWLSHLKQGAKGRVAHPHHWPSPYIIQVSQSLVSQRVKDQHCHCCGTGSIPGLGTSGAAKDKKQVSQRCRIEYTTTCLAGN